MKPPTPVINKFCTVKILRLVGDDDSRHILNLNKEIEEYYAKWDYDNCLNTLGQLKKLIDNLDIYEPNSSALSNYNYSKFILAISTSNYGEYKDNEKFTKSLQDSEELLIEANTILDDNNSIDELRQLRQDCKALLGYVWYMLSTQKLHQHETLDNRVIFNKRDSISICDDKLGKSIHIYQESFDINPNRFIRKYTLQETGLELLMFCICTEANDLFEMIIDKHLAGEIPTLDPNVSTRFGQQLLVTAIVKQNYEAVEYLLALGANPIYKGPLEENTAPIVYAIKRGKHHLVKKFIDALCDYKCSLRELELLIDDLKEIETDELASTFAELLKQ